MSVPMYDALGDVERGHQESLLSSLFQVKVTMNTDNISNLLRSMLEKINYNFAIVKLLQKTCISQKDLKSELDIMSENMRGELKGVVEDRETSFDALKRDMVEATRKIIKEEIETSEKEWLNDRVKFHEAVKNETQRIELEMKKQGEETAQKIWRLIDEVEELKSYQLGIEGRMKNDKYHNTYINNRINRIDEMLNHMVIEGRSSSAPLERTESPKNEEVVPLSPTKVQFEEKEQVGDEVIIPPLNLKNFNLDIPRLSNSDLPKRPTMSKSLSETTMSLDLKHKLPHVKYYQQDNVEKLQEEINTIYESLKKMKEQINTSLQQNTIVEGVGKKIIPILDSLRKELEDKISLKVDKRDLVYYLEKKADGFEVIKMRTNYDSALALFGRVENEIREQSVNFEKLAYALRRQLRGELTLKEMDRIVSQFQQRDHRRSDSDNPSPVSHQIDGDQFTLNEQEMSTPPYLSVRRSTKLVQGALRPKSAMSLRSISPPVNLVGVDGVIYKGVLPSDNDLYKGQILYGGTKSIPENNYSMRTDSRTSSPVPPFFDHDIGKPPSRLEDRSMSPYLHESNVH